MFGTHTTHNTRTQRGGEDEEEEATTGVQSGIHNVGFDPQDPILFIRRRKKGGRGEGEAYRIKNQIQTLVARRAIDIGVAWRCAELCTYCTHTTTQPIRKRRTRQRRRRRRRRPPTAAAATAAAAATTRILLTR